MKTAVVLTAIWAVTPLLQPQAPEAIGDSLLRLEGYMRSGEFNLKRDILPTGELHYRNFGMDSAETPQEPPSKPNFIADDRIAAEAPEHKIPLATPVELPIHVSAPGVQRIVLSQSNARGPIPFGDGVAKVLREEVNRQFVEFTPLRLGKIQLDIVVLFTDGGVAVQHLPLEVEAPAAAPQRFQADKHALRLLIQGSKDHDRAILESSATYANVPNAIPLDFHFVEYSLLPTEGKPAVELHDGQVKALRVGEAVVVARYGGLVDRVRVLVKPEDWK